MPEVLQSGSGRSAPKSGGGEEEPRTLIHSFQLTQAASYPLGSMLLGSLYIVL